MIETMLHENPGQSENPDKKDADADNAEQVAGFCITVTQEGTRPLLVEVQALVDEAHAPNPRRLCVGLEQNRLAMLLAVLHRHAGVACFDQDVFVNAVGGVRITEPAVDLAVLLSIVSSLKNKLHEKKFKIIIENYNRSRILSEIYAAVSN